MLETIAVFQGRSRSVWIMIIAIGVDRRGQM